ncbi:MULTISPECIES: FUSC family protein [unclassified Methanobrevibacter]|jgi:gas vesicle protein|uniref:FUSC family protein n=2 Tax=unclassified Methanobrevibacter TaxID=2638681 RepID=UPI0039B85CFD
MEKITYKNRIKRLIKSEKRPNWPKMINMLLGLTLSSIIGYLLFPQLIYLFIITSILMGLLVNTPYPLKTLTHHAIKMIICGGLAVFTATFATLNTYIAILFFIIWLIFFIIMNIKGGLNRTVGLFTMFTYFISLNIVLTNVLNITSTTHPLHILHLALYCGAIGSFAIFLETSPTLIIKYLKHDPTKRKILAELYSPKIKYDKFIKNRTIILKADQSDYTFTLIHLAMSLMISSFNLQYVKDDISKENQEYFKNFIKEVDKLQTQISTAIIKNNDKGLILNLKHLRRIVEDINQIKDTKPESLNVKKSIHTYLKTFQKINLGLTGAYTEENIPLPEDEESTWTNLKDNLTLNNINVRYGIRFAIATNLSFIFDILTGGIIQYAATISSFFTMKPDAKFTKITVLKRVIATLAGSALATLIAIILLNFNLSYLIPVLAVLTMSLFYAYMQNNYSIGIFFAMMMVVFIQPSNLLVSQAMYRIFGTAIGALISFLVGMFILPNETKNNLSILIANKIEFNKNLIIHILNENEDNLFKDNKLIHDNNLRMTGSIDRISEEYEDISDDIDLFIELSSSLNQIHGNFLSLKRYIFRTNRDFKFEKALNLFDNFFTNINNVILEDDEIYFEEEFEELTSIVDYLETKYSDNKDIILLRYFKWIYEDMEVVYDLVKTGRRNSTFTRFNQMI